MLKKHQILLSLLSPLLSLEDNSSLSRLFLEIYELREDFQMIFSFEDDQYACNILKWLGPMPPYGQRVPTDQGGRTWQAFGGGKHGHETFRQARNYNFRDKCVVFARNLKFSNLTQ